MEVMASFKALRGHLSIPVSSLGQAFPEDFIVLVALKPAPFELYRTGQKAVGRTGSGCGLGSTLHTRPALQNLACHSCPTYPTLPASLDSSPSCLNSVYQILFSFFPRFLPMVPECRPLVYFNNHAPQPSREASASLYAFGAQNLGGSFYFFIQGLVI